VLYYTGIQCYTESIDEFDHDPIAYSNRALAYMKVKQYDKAIEDSSRALDFGVNSKFYWIRGLAYYKSSQYKKSVHGKLITIISNNNNNNYCYYVVDEYALVIALLLLGMVWSIILINILLYACMWVKILRNSWRCNLATK